MTERQRLSLAAMLEAQAPRTRATDTVRDGLLV
jgi:hypothetical protein